MEGKINQFGPQKKKKKDLKGELRIWRIKMQARVHVVSYSRIQFASNESKLVPMGLDPGTPQILSGP